MSCQAGSCTSCQMLGSDADAACIWKLHNSMTAAGTKAEGARRAKVSEVTM